LKYQSDLKEISEKLHLGGGLERLNQLNADWQEVEVILGRSCKECQKKTAAACASKASELKIEGHYERAAVLYADAFRLDPNKKSSCRKLGLLLSEYLGRYR